MTDPICPTCKKPITDEDIVMHHNCLPPTEPGAECLPPYVPTAPKPREWFSHDIADAYDNTGELSGDDIFVEKSAYDAVKSEHDSLSKFAEDLRKERDAIKLAYDLANIFQLNERIANLERALSYAKSHWRVTSEPYAELERLEGGEL